VLTILRIEYFKNSRQPLFWALLAFLTLILSLIFHRLCVDYLTEAQLAVQQNNIVQSVSQAIVKPFCSWTIVMFAFLLPILATQTLSHEFRQNTFHVWIRSRFDSVSIVFGKAAFILSFVFFTLFLLALMFGILSFETNLDLSFLFCGLLTVILMSSAILSFNLFISSCFIQPLYALALATIGNLLWMSLEWLNPFGEKGQSFCSELSLIAHSHHLLNGVLYLPDLIFYFVFSAFWLSMTALCVHQKMGQHK